MQERGRLFIGPGTPVYEGIDHSVEQVGWGRSMVMAADGVMIAGNHALETAQRIAGQFRRNRRHGLHLGENPATMQRHVASGIQHGPRSRPHPASECAT